jgi:hypothetical protein
MWRDRRRLQRDDGSRSSVTVEQVLEGDAKPSACPMKSASRRHRMATHYGRNLRGRETLPLRQQKNLAVARSQAPKRLWDDRLLPTERRGLFRDRRRLARQTFVERDEATFRPPLVRDDPAGRRVQPRARGIAIGDVIKATPSGQEDVGGCVLRVARRTGAPAAVRHDVRAVRREESVEAAPALTFAVRHVISMSGRPRIVSSRSPSNDEAPVSRGFALAGL